MTQIFAAVLIIAGGAIACIAAARLLIRLAPWLMRMPAGGGRGLAHRLFNRKLRPTLVWELAALALGYAVFRMGMILATLY